MKIIKKKWRKTPLVIDYRAAQNNNFNGVTIATKNWVKELIKTSKKDQPIYIWTNSKKPLPSLPFSKPNLTHIHTTHSNLKLQLLWFFNIGKSLSQLLQINQNYILFSPDIRTLKIGEKCIRHIQYIHDIAFLKFHKTITFKTKFWFFLNQPKKIYKKADLILTNSTFTKKEITKKFGKQKIQIIHPSIPKKLKTKYIKHPSTFHLIISNLQRRKNLHQTIQSFIKTKQNLLIIGNKEKMFSKYKLQKSPYIKFYSNLSHEEKNFLIKKSTATIYPSKYEGFGLPILESIRLKTPCLTHNTPPYNQLFSKQTTDIKNLFNYDRYITPTKTSIYSLKSEVRKLNKLIYNLD